MGASASVSDPAQGCPHNIQTEQIPLEIDDEKVIQFSQSAEVIKIVRGLIQNPFSFDARVDLAAINLVAASWESIVNGNVGRYKEIASQSSKDMSCVSWFVRK